MIEITNELIDLQQVLQSVHSERCGANLLFSGTTRRFTDDRETEQLEYDCYREMAIREMETLCEAAKQRWNIHAISIVHRTGVVGVGETSIAVAISSPHRIDAFQAGQWLMDQFKREVPIWKKEQWADGTSEWIHPDNAVKTDQPQV